MFDILDLIAQFLSFGNRKKKISYKNNRSRNFLDIFGTLFIILLYLIFILGLIYQTMLILGKFIRFSIGKL